jgi:hypothetical protein
VTIYTAKRSCLILKALGTVQHSIFCCNYIQPTSLHVLYKVARNSKATRISISARGRMSPDKNADIGPKMFPQDPDTPEWIEG